jgi:hypothetical protein
VAFTFTFGAVIDVTAAPTVIVANGMEWSFPLFGIVGRAGEAFAVPVITANSP